MPETSLLSLLGQVTTPEKPARHRVWYFGFTHNSSEVKLPWWQMLWVARDPAHLRHCYAFTQVGDYLLFVEPERDKIEFVVKYPTKECPVLRADRAAQELSDYGHIIVRHTYIPSISGRKSIWNWVPSCVTVVKCATGYSSYARTPRKLLHSLIRDGAHVFLKGEQERWADSLADQSQKDQAQSN